MMIFPTDSERRLKNALEEKEEVKNVEYNERGCTGVIYISADIREAGIDLWDLHDDFNFDIVCSWHDPVKEKMNMCFRVK